MNGYEVIQAAKEHFGETSASLYDDAIWESWARQALLDTYAILPPEYWRQRIANANITLVGGTGAVPDEVDVILDARTSGGVALHLVPPQAIRQMDANPLLAAPPDAPVYCVQGKDIFVRPSTTATSVMYQTPPDVEAISFSMSEADLADLPEVLLPSRFHPALIHRVVAYAYAQEEDIEQASYYLNLWNRGLPRAEEQE